MGNEFISSAVTVATAIIGVAIIAVLVSRNANTQGVIGTAAQGFAGVLGTAISPVTGGGGMSGGIGGGGFGGGGFGGGGFSGGGFTGGGVGSGMTY